MIDKGQVNTEVCDGIATITFSHPKSNSLPGALLRSLAQTIEQLGSSNDVRVIVLKSEGDKAFCAGASFDEFQAVKTLEQSRYFFGGFPTLLMAMKQCPKFIVTRVQGKVVGGGVGIVAASDYVLAVESASVRLSELALGIGPFMIGPAVQRKVGVGAFSAMTIDADARDAAWAKAHALYAEIYPSITELDAAISVLSKKLASCHAAAMIKLKSILWEGTEDWGRTMSDRADITSELALTDFVQCAVAAAGKR